MNGKENSVSEKLGRILVMDDEEIVTDIAEQMLAHLGYEVNIAGNGEEAIEFYRQALAEGKGYALVIMDLNIPRGMGGEEAVKKVLEIDANARVVVSSGYSSDPVVSNYRHFGFCGCITKPFDFRMLQDVVKENIG